MRKRFGTLMLTRLSPVCGLSCDCLRLYVAAPELNNIAKAYGKFWCTWKIHRGDRLPKGAPELMMSPQGVEQGVLRPELVKFRDDKYNIWTDELKHKRAQITGNKMTSVSHSI
ncbi:unnamed protein product [Brassica rapa]|uniref:Uncharacterized protein n=2 Tax=Brassica TaxID=3705 RepID=A0A8D9HL54_BRACM|nr:unnamed protein product [Brassica napus]CAG7901588.1 unnamed protein product [Brassica rapa]